MLLLGGIVSDLVCWVLGIQLPATVSLVLVVGSIRALGAFVGVLLVCRVILGLSHDHVMPLEFIGTRLGGVGRLIVCRTYKELLSHISDWH